MSKLILNVQLIVFWLDSFRYAIKLESVREITRAVEITSVANAPPFILGLVNVRGEVVPVVDIRSKLNLPASEIRLTDHMIVLMGCSGSLAIVCDKVEELIEVAPERVNLVAHDGRVFVDAIADDGLIVVYDVASMLSKEEELQLQESLAIR